MLLILALLFWASMGALLHSYVVYPLVLPMLARLFGKPVRRDPTYVPSVAFIVPVYNEESVIKAKLENILRLDYPAESLSVWIGSDCSNDKTHEIVRLFPDPRVHLWIAPERGGKTGVLNNLTPMVKADILVFTDANTMHRPDSLRKLVAPFADPVVGGVAAHIDHAVRDSEQREERFYRSFESRQKEYESRLHSTISAFGGYYAVRATLFRPIPPNAYSNDDVLIPMNVVRRRRRVWFEPSATAFEDTTEALGAEVKRRVRIGAGNFQSLVWLADFLNPLRGWPWFCFVSHKALRWTSPLLVLVALLSCAALCALSAAPLYCLLLGLGLAFIVAGLSSRIVPTKTTGYMLYFLAMNAALLLGFLRFARGIRSAAWERTERQ
ncbi:MAG: glycosyltransferase [Chitinivibrionales bacterium]|nr:glycosyltransferase [Chitinivibrionales bacterium]